MPLGVYVYLCVLMFVSLMPTVVAFWKGEGPWKLAALVMSLLSFVVFATWTAVAANFGGIKRPDTWAPFIATWSLAWLFAKLAIDERARERALDLAWAKANAAELASLDPSAEQTRKASAPATSTNLPPQP